MRAQCNYLGVWPYENAGVTQHFRPLLGPNLPMLLRKPGQSLNPRFDSRSIMVTPSVDFDF